MLQRPPNFLINYQSSLANGLVFAGLGKHPSTNLYADSSGFGNSGLLTNMTPASDWIWIPELGRWGLSFGGSTQHVVALQSIITYTPLTIAAWGYTTLDGTSQDVCAVSNTADGHGWRINLGMNAAGDPLRAITRDSGTRIATVGTITVNRWFHAAATFASSANRVAWLNGVSGSAETTNTAPNGINSIHIGSHYGTNAVLTGRVADVLVWNTVLSAAQIQQLADPSNAMLSGLILPPRRRWWPVVSAATTKIPVFMNHYRNLRVSA